MQALETHQSQTFGHGRLHPSLLVCLSFQRTQSWGVQEFGNITRVAHIYVLALLQGPLCACSMLWAGKSDDKFFTTKAMAYMLLEQPPTMCVMATKSHNTRYMYSPEFWGAHTQSDPLYHHTPLTWGQQALPTTLYCKQQGGVAMRAYHHRQQG